MHYSPYNEIFPSLNSAVKEAVSPGVTSSTACAPLSRVRLQRVQIGPKYNFIGHPILVIEVEDCRSRLFSLEGACIVDSAAVIGLNSTHLICASDSYNQSCVSPFNEYIRIYTD